MTPTKSTVWHVIYTRSRSEKKYWQTSQQVVLPVLFHCRRNSGSGRTIKSIVEVPLLPGYLYILTGLKGELVKTHGNKRFILRIDSLGINFMLDIPADGIVYSKD